MNETKKIGLIKVAKDFVDSFSMIDNLSLNDYARIYLSLRRGEVILAKKVALLLSTFDTKEITLANAVNMLEEETLKIIRDETKNEGNKISL